MGSGGREGGLHSIAAAAFAQREGVRRVEAQRLSSAAAKCKTRREGAAPRRDVVLGMTLPLYYAL